MEEQNKPDTNESFEEIVIDFGEICRFCLAETQSNISILDKCVVDNSIDYSLDTIYNFVTKLSSIKMEGAEYFPSLVCQNCHELVKVCYNFSQTCQQSDNLLRACYEKTMQETKAKLIDEKNSISIPPPPEKNNVLSLKLEKPKPDDVQTKSKWKPTSKHKNSLSKKQADSIKLKYQRMNSLTERLKEAQSKLEQDILRSNDLMIGLPRNDELKKALSGSKPFYSCPQCTMRFSNAEALRFHYIGTHGQIRKVRNVTRYKCKKCVKFFIKQDELIKHYGTVHEISESNLTEEDKNYKIKKSVRMGKRKFYCLHCVPYKLFQNREELVKHLDECHEMNQKVDAKLFGCGKCTSNPTFSSRSSLNEHLRNVHHETNEDFFLKDIKSSSDVQPNANLKLFKVYVCTDCSPPLSFTNVDACTQHKIDSHGKELENISVKELTPVYVDSLDVFRQCQNQNNTVSFKVLCKNCEPPMEFTSTSEFVSHICSVHDQSTLENWDIESKPPVLGKDESRVTQMWKCSECPVSYHRKQSLFCHMKEKHNIQMNIQSVKCPECSESFQTNRQLIQHGISAHQTYFADFHKIYKKKILQISKDETDNRVRNFECDICQRKYVCKTSLKKHILKAHLGKQESESVVCSYCGKTVASKLNLKSHIEFVHEALFVSCPICKKKINFRTIGKHYKTHQTDSMIVDSKNLFLCNHCGKVLKSKRGFEDHQKLHKNIRDQLCDICGSGFTTKKFLYLHKKIHEGGQRKVFECPQCDKVFSGRHTLNRHLLTHSGQKNFICEICSKCFYTLQELNRHVRCHKKEYRFDCQLCDKRFLDKSRFRQHMMRHRNVRPHKCHFCDKMFIVRGKMNLHMASKHNVEIQTTKKVWKDPKTYVPLDDLL